MDIVEITVIALAVVWALHVIAGMHRTQLEFDTEADADERAHELSMMDKGYIKVPVVVTGEDGGYTTFIWRHGNENAQPE